MFDEDQSPPSYENRHAAAFGDVWSSGHEAAGVDDGGGGAGAGGRQPNFLQKLFDFLALAPHPCPDVIYWAADSKQLVIARPDELARSVLPRLYKHDKVSSFGRQLNIYGFARVYPGRQFKDDKGNILDASVWAHPTLQRLSTPSEVSAVKRRAAPKLFRTRRLANGQIVRTKAGPEVERKFREVKEDLANERRSKNGWPMETRPTPIPHRATATPSFVIAPTNTRQSTPETEARDVFDWSSSSGSNWGNVPMLPVEHVAGGEAPRYDPFPASFDTRRIGDTGHQGLSSIPEGQPMSPQVSYTTYPADLHESHSPFKNDSPYRPQLPLMITDSFPPIPGRFYRSCPASIHTSPVLSARVLPITANHFPPSFAHRSAVSGYQHNTLQLKVDTHVPLRIAAPAAADPFAASYQDVHHPRLDISALSPDSYIAASLPPSVPPTPYQLSPDPSPNDVVSRAGSIYPQTQSWERTGVIDPRWVSPKGSAWNTPAATPRSGSPVSRMSVEQGQMGMVNGSSSFGQPARRYSGSAEVRVGIMGPPSFNP